MSYLPNTPYAPTTPMLPPQLGLGGPAPMNPLAAMPMPGAGFPGATAPGLPQAGIPAGLSQDAFGPAAAAGAPAAPNNQQGSVFQHPSGGLADVNQSLSGGNFWSSWKGISTIVAGLAVAIYTGIAIYKGKLNIFEGAGGEYGSKAFHELTGDLKTAADKLVEKAQAAKKAFVEGLTKENVGTKATEFKKPFTDINEKNLKSQITEEEHKVFAAYEKAHTDYADKIAEGLKADKALADVLSSEEVKTLDAAIQPAEGAFTKKLTAPEPAAAEATGTTATGTTATGTTATGTTATGTTAGQKGRMASIVDSLRNRLPNNPFKSAPKPQAAPSGATTATTGS